MIDCEFAANQPTNGAGCTCSKMSEWLGWRAGCAKEICARCIKSGANTQPVTAAIWRGRLAFHLKLRLHVGDCPRYTRASEPLDMADAFRKFRQLMGLQAARDLFEEMAFRQASISEGAGGWQPEVVAEKLAALAVEHGLEASVQHSAAEEGDERREYLMRPDAFLADAERLYQPRRRAPQARTLNPSAPCVHRGETLRIERKSCCGEVEVFRCARDKQEKWHTKCRRCSDYTSVGKDRLA